MNAGLYLLEDLWWFYDRYFPAVLGLTLLVLSITGLVIGGWLQFSGVREYHVLSMAAIGGAVLLVTALNRAEGGDG